MWNRVWTVAKALYPLRRLYAGLAGLAALFVVAHWVPLLEPVAWITAALGFGLLVADAVLHVLRPTGIDVRREVPDRLSNGDPNPVTVQCTNRYPFPIQVEVIDEPPVEFQIRDAVFQLHLPVQGTRSAHYTLRPTKRGRYDFGKAHAYARTPLGLVARRYTADAEKTVAVYPSFIQMRRIELMASSDRLQEVGVKRIRRRGRSTAFEHIRTYVLGDDYRLINWKATARRAELMVNQYQEERGQPIYCAINTGRVMALPFEGMTLLDYSVNATLALANVALQKQDRVGVLTFDKKPTMVVPTGRGSGHRVRIQEALYHLKTGFPEADYRRLAVFTERHLSRRGLLLLFTNVEGRPSLERQLPMLKSLNRRHTLVVVFFENPVLSRAAFDPSVVETHSDVEDAYVRTMAERFAHEKHEIVRLLRRHGILSVLAPPEALTVETLNAYLALKAEGLHVI